MGNAFLKGVETPQQESAFLTMQMAVTRMSRDVSFISTSPPDERTFLLKDYATLKDMDPESYDIQSHNLLSEYKHRPKVLDNYCLAAFVSELRIEYPKNVTFEDPFDDNFDDDQQDPDDKNTFDKQILKMPNGIVIKKRTVPRILRYLNYNVKRDPENHYRKRLMLFLPWRNEEKDLYSGYKIYGEHYIAKESLI